MSQSETFQSLDKASQAHENEIVINLAPDRILHFLGVYVIVMLAVVTKVTELAGQGRLSCFPVHQNKSDLTFIKHANQYCWESSQIDLKDSAHGNVNFSACSDTFGAEDTDQFLQNPTFVKRFLQWMPYAMLLEAFLFALPNAYWHFTVGARLMGHLKFTQILLQDIYESVKSLPAGIYRKKAYDEKGDALNCWRRKSTKDGVSRHRGRVTLNCCRKRGTTSDQASSFSHVAEEQDEPEHTQRKNSSNPSTSNTGRISEETGDQSTFSQSGAVPNEFKRNDSESNKNLTICNDSDEGESLLKASENGKQTSDAKTTDERKQTKKELVSPEDIELVDIATTADSTKANFDNDAAQPSQQFTSSAQPSNSNCEDPRISETKQPSVERDLESVIPTKTRKGNDSFENLQTKSTQPLETSIDKSKMNLQDVVTKIVTPEFTKSPGVAVRNHQNIETKGSRDVKEGKLYDRHIFSMLCNENFASMQYYPYLKSVGKLTTAEAYENSIDDFKEDEEKILPMKHAILRTFCNKDTFKSCFMVDVFFKKCALSTIMALLILTTIVIFFVVVIHQTIATGSFLCEIPYHAQCLRCTLTGLTDVYAAFFANFSAVLIYLILSVVHWRFVAKASDHPLSRFLDHIKPFCSVALVAAQKVADNSTPVCQCVEK